MKFVLYGFAISSMPGGAWGHFWRQFSDIWRHVWLKMYVLEISSPESLRLIESEILQNIPEPMAKLRILHAKLLYK